MPSDGRRLTETDAPRGGPALFLLYKPSRTASDGYMTRSLPFMIGYGGRDVYAAFGTPGMAMWFVREVGLDTEYKAVPLSSVPYSSLKDAEYALVLWTKVLIRQLLTGMDIGPAFEQNLVRLR